MRNLVINMFVTIMTPILLKHLTDKRDSVLLPFFNSLREKIFKKEIDEYNSRYIVNKKEGPNSYNNNGHLHQAFRHNLISTDALRDRQNGYISLVDVSEAHTSVESDILITECSFLTLPYHTDWASLGNDIEFQFFINSHQEDTLLLRTKKEVSHLNDYVKRILDEYVIQLKGSARDRRNKHYKLYL